MWKHWDSNYYSKENLFKENAYERVNKDMYEKAFYRSDELFCKSK